MASISRRRCAPLFDQTRPFLRPGRAGQSVAAADVKAGRMAAALWRGLALTAASTTAVAAQLRRAFTGTAGEICNGPGDNLHCLRARLQGGAVRSARGARQLQCVIRPGRHCCAPEWLGE